MKKIYIAMVLAILSTTLMANLRLPRLISDNCVLQRESNIYMWGWAAPNTKVTLKVTWENAAFNALSDADGYWEVEVPTQAASTNESIEVSADGKSILVQNVAIGEVWICSGQSNMVMPISGNNNDPNIRGWAQMLQANKYPDLHFITIDRKAFETMQDDCQSTKGWQVSSTSSIASFSAVAYNFGLTLNEVLNVPVGLISTCWGGSRVETWLSRDRIESLDGIDQTLAFNGKMSQHIPGMLYNSMIAPITNYTARGFIWYQGEANTKNNPLDYPTLLAEMVKQWREDWDNAQMPFYQVLLAPYHYGDEAEGEILPRFWEQQMMAQSMIPHSGSVCTVDLGNTHTIHPGRKTPIGQRLATMTLLHDYDIKGLPLDAPTYKSMEINGSKVTLTFNNITRGANDFAQHDAEQRIDFQGFEIAGSDKVFYPAKAQPTRQHTIIISAPEVSAPIAVRYAFHNLPNCNVHTGFGQPLVPFRTDNW